MHEKFSLAKDNGYIVDTGACLASRSAVELSANITSSPSRPDESSICIGMVDARPASQRTPSVFIVASPAEAKAFAQWIMEAVNSIAESTDECWTCPFCGHIATQETRPVQISQSRTCSCGAVAWANIPRDFDEITDAAIGFFHVAIRPESRGYEQALRQDILKSGVEIKQGATRDVEWGPDHREQMNYVWFRRSSHTDIHRPA